MEIVYIFPIGGILTIVGFIACLLGFAVWGAFADNVDAAKIFAAEHTLTVLIVLAIIALLAAIFVTALCNWKKGLPFGIIFYLSMVLSYNLTLIWVNDFIKTAADLFIIVLIMLFPMLLFWGFQILLALLPNLILFIPNMLRSDAGEGEPWKYDGIWNTIWGIILTGAYCYFIYLFEFESCIQNLFT